MNINKPDYADIVNDDANSVNVNYVCQAFCPGEVPLTRYPANND